MTTIKQVNKALHAAGLDCQLHKGDGYCYFWGPSVERSPVGTMVYVPRISDLTVEQWLEEAETIATREWR